MEKLKVISEKYNDKDILQFDSKKFAELVQKHEFVEVPDDETDFSKYVGKAFIWGDNNIYYPAYNTDYWFSFGDDASVYLYGLDNDNMIIGYVDCNLNNIVENPVRVINLDYSDTSLTLTEQDMDDMIDGKAILCIKDDDSDNQVFYPVCFDRQAQSINLIGYIMKNNNNDLTCILTSAHARDNGFDVLENNAEGWLFPTIIANASGSVYGKLSTLKVAGNIYSVGTTILYKHTVTIDSQADSETYIIISNSSVNITSSNFNAKASRNELDVLKVWCNGDSGTSGDVFGAEISQDKIYSILYDGSTRLEGQLAQDYTVTDNVELL